MNTIQLIELITGDLMIVLNNKEELQELKLKLNENEITAELLDLSRYTGNGWYCNQVIGLTEADNICFNAIYNDSNTEPVDFEKIWYYPYYMVKSYTDELLKDSFVIFKLVE